VSAAAARIRAFPWHSLEATTREEASALRDVRRWLLGHGEPARLSTALSDLLETRVGVIVRRARSATAARGLEGAAGVLVAPSDAPDLAHGLVVEAELALVAAMVARVTRRKAPAVLEAGVAASPGAAGALGAVVLAALRRAHAGVAMRIVAAGPATALEADLARTARAELRAVSLTVLLGDEAFEARVALPREAALAVPSPSWDARALAALGPAPIAIPLVAHAVGSDVAEVATLAAGDVLVLPAWPLSRGGTGGWTGPVVLAGPGSSSGCGAQLGDDGRLVLRGEVMPLVEAAEAEMSDEADKAALVEAIGEVPVVVRVEIGEATMAARDWATLGRGDVVALGRRVGEAVVLRVGGVAVARGDLVEIDGEVGVRIVERLAAERA
jgi:flagellar motor switch/type III secretory pathway protein FliN